MTSRKIFLAFLFVTLVYALPVFAQDSDGDGMPDSYELAHPCLNYLTPDGNLDPDDDQMTSLEEYTYSTSLNPCSADTDGGGMPDGAEVLAGKNPLNASDDVRNELATYDTLYTAPICQSGYSPCLVNESLINGRDTMDQGAEPNQPNTISADPCEDGTMGTYLNDESINAINVAVQGGNYFLPSSTIKVSAKVWCYGPEDNWYIYYSESADFPSWTLEDQGVCTGTGMTTVSSTFAITSAYGNMAVRVIFSYDVSESTCDTGEYTDRDDVVIGIVPPCLHDNDGDNHGLGCFMGADCNDNNPNVWDTCATCRDNDGDNWWAGCNQYITHNGPDCDDNVSTGGGCHNSCTTFYQDSDNDTHGNPSAPTLRCTVPSGYVSNNTDCNDANTNVWSKCATCVDDDGDGWYKDCDRYQTISGPDCDDLLATGPTCHDTCINFYQDYDSDAHGNPGVSINRCVAPNEQWVPDDTDCNDNNTDVWSKCATCIDTDGDGWYKDCDRYIAHNGPDCDDNSATGASCHNTCANFYQDTDGDAHGNPSVFLDRCAAPTGYVADNTDCNDANTNAWNTCATCVDVDGDGWYNLCNRYVGINGPDCDDNVSTGTSCHNTCSNFYQDTDNDAHGNPSVSLNRCVAPTGYVADNTDCSDANTNAWNTCATCVDADADGWYLLCNRYVGINGPDCSDTNTNAWNTCATCVDADADGWYKLCNRYQTVSGPDCDDTSATGTSCHNSCANFYRDADNDAHGNASLSQNTCVAAVGYVADNTDCNDANPNAWNTCATCLDTDADTWYAGCNAYVTVSGPDCSPTNPNHWSDCGICVDADGDNYGAGCNLGADCDDTVATGASCHTSCSTFYQDSDADTYGNINATVSRCSVPAGYVANSTDCNDANTNTWNTCATCLDTDGDSWFAGCNRYQTIAGPDCAPASAAHWNDCGLCTDADGDNYGTNCNLGADCDDNVATGTSCHNTCSSFYQDSDNDSYGNNSVSLSRCTAPAGYVANNTDCNDANPNTWNTCATCLDTDGDSWFAGCNAYVTVSGPDCAPASSAHWNDCGLCTDADGDNYGAGCNLGADCDDNASTGGSCHNSCSNFYQDSDADTHGNPASSLSRCTAPAGYVANNNDCSDTNPNAWASCSTCLDTDGDSWYAGCDAYVSVSGPDCAPANPNHWSDCGLCTDADGDNYGTGCNKGPDCDDTVATGAPCHNTCSTYYADSDSDTFGNPSSSVTRCSLPAGYVANNTDCNDANPNAWTNCSTCLDTDGDLWYAGCDAYVTVSGPDCQPNNPNHWNDCGPCVDLDGDNYGTGCNKGADCDDTVDTGASCHNTCSNFYRDSDSDAHGNIALSVNRCAAPTGYVADNTDCNDANPNTWSTCATCADTDADTWYAGCNAYVTVSGPDCAPASAAHWNDCGTCTDADGDNYGTGCNLGADCDDNVATGGGCHNTCTNFYQDSDGDTHGNNSVSLSRCSAPAGYVANNNDCSDVNPNAWSSCATCLDTDADTWYAGCDAYVTVSGPDCAPANPNHWNDCGTCTDADGDNYGAGCNLGADCDDNVATGGGCHNTCSNFYQDSDGDTHGNNSVSLSRCSAPAGYVANNNDCSDVNPNAWSSCATCLDTDADTWYAGCDAYVTVSGPDCAPANPNHWNDCGTCTDADGDNYGAGCNLGADCDDTVATGGGCHNTCSNFYQDSDGDTHGNNSVSLSRCSAPAGYVASNNDCSDVNPNAWSSCATCLDTDADTWYAGCDAYVTVSGPDCAPANPNHWNDCGLCTDADGDNYGTGCNNGADCDDTVATGASCHNTCSNFYQDSDNDGYGNAGVSASRCVAPAGYVANSTDCNDSSNVVYPFAPELCDTIDNQCPGNPGYGTIDEGCGPAPWDTDGDYLPDVYEAAHTGSTPPLDPNNALDGPADFDGDGNSNRNEYWNGSDPWTANPVPGAFDNPGCYYWADGNGDGIPDPLDLAKLKTAIAGAGQPTDSNVSVLPPTFETLDLDRDGTLSPLDISILKQMVAGASQISGYPSQAAALETVSAPTGSVAVGSTTHVTLSVHSASGAVGFAPGFGVVFQVVSGNAALLGGDGAASGEAAGNRYDMSMQTVSGSSANIVVLVTGSGPITIAAKIPACGTYPVGKWSSEVNLSPSIVINGP